MGVFNPGNGLFPAARVFTSPWIADSMLVRRKESWKNSGLFLKWLQFGLLMSSSNTCYFLLCVFNPGNSLKHCM
jgi:hypothetical protein